MDSKTKTKQNKVYLLCGRGGIHWRKDEIHFLSAYLTRHIAERKLWTMTEWAEHVETELTLKEVEI